MNNTFGVLLFLSCLVLAAWYSLKFADWIHAVRYEWRKNRKKAVPASPGPKTGFLPDGHFAYVDEISLWTQADYLKARRRLTPDRPSDPLHQEIEALTGRQAAVKFPRGS